MTQTFHADDAQRSVSSLMGYYCTRLCMKNQNQVQSTLIGKNTCTASTTVPLKCKLPPSRKKRDSSREKRTRLARNETCLAGNENCLVRNEKFLASALQPLRLLNTKPRFIVIWVAYSHTKPRFEHVIYVNFLFTK